MDDVIRLLGVRDSALSADEVLAAVTDPRAGGTTLFLGTVRDHDGGRDVSGLGYSAHPSVEDAMRVVAEKVAASHDVVALAALHRVGDLRVGDVAVVVAASAVHRDTAFEAGRMLIDDLKHEVPIWKHQTFTDGDEEWVGSA